MNVYKMKLILFDVSIKDMKSLVVKGQIKQPAS